MTDYTLKFPDEATATAVLEPFIQTHAIDVIGVIYKPTGEMLLGEDGEYPAMAPQEGWYVNVRGPDASDLEPYIVVVKTPVRVWA